jgi:hypothetical protein
MPTELTELILDFTPKATLAVLSERAAEFSSPMEMKMTALALSPAFRQAAESEMDAYWADGARREDLLGVSDREVIIGSGFHAAVYAAIRVKAGYPRPLVLERSNRAGGTFAMTGAPTFYLNSRNRPGQGGIAGDRRASLNYLPGAPIQPANFSMDEYQTNAEMALAIRLTLAECADVITGVTVQQVDGPVASPFLLTNVGRYDPSRIIDARGIGDPVAPSKPESGIYNFPDFMQLMTGPFPLRGVRNVAVLGGGDSAKCAIEALIGIGPKSSMTIPVLDRVDRIDWFGESLPTTCNDWRREVRGRYQAIGPSLRPDRFGERLINVYQDRAYPIGLPTGGALINGRTYDMTITATGSTESTIDGLARSTLYRLADSDEVVARTDANFDNVYRVGPHADLPFNGTELGSGIAEIDANKVSMFRTGPKTAALAATLPNI